MTSASDETPKLRHVEPIRLSVNGRQVIALKDPLQLRRDMVYFPQGALPILAMLDGRHTLRDIQTDLTRRTGRLVFLDDVRAVVRALEEAFLLEGEVFREAFTRKTAEYRALPARPASHAGPSYSAEPSELRRELNSYFTGADGPGEPRFGTDPRRPVGLIAPHIDIRAGGRCFAAGYHALAAGVPSDVYVILGTGHAGVEGLFTASTLDFDTPLGRVATDRELLSALETRLGSDPAAEEILHANEHVIEFQLIFLQHIFSGRHDFTVVPILCSLSHHIFSDESAFADHRATFFDFCSAVKDVCGEASRTVCFIASADLDHIGPRYGDSFVPHRGTVSGALEADARLLSVLEKIDTAGFITDVAADNDERRICGFSPITAMLHCMDAEEGKMLSLDFAPVDERNSFVTFASMIFH
jgi:MEMO1 family protein